MKNKLTRTSHSSSGLICRIAAFGLFRSRNSCSHRFFPNSATDKSAAAHSGLPCTGAKMIPSLNREASIIAPFRWRMTGDSTRQWRATADQRGYRPSSSLFHRLLYSWKTLTLRSRCQRTSALRYSSCHASGSNSRYLNGNRALSRAILNFSDRNCPGRSVLIRFLVAGDFSRQGTRVPIQA